MTNNIEISEKQAEYIKNANHLYNIKMGATQSGKTHLDSVYTIVSRILERAGAEGINVIIGVSRGTIERNVLGKMRYLWGNSVVSPINSQNVATICGEKVYCIGAKDSRQESVIRGATIKYLYVDEFPDISKSVFELLPSRLSLPYSCCDLTGNPKSPSHWSEDFIHSENDIFFQRYSLYDNPFLAEKTIHNIENAYRGTVFFDRYVLGLPKRAEGLVFSKFADNPAPWIIKPEALPEYYRSVEVGFDIGGNGSAYALTCTAIGVDFTRYKLKSEKKQAEDLNMSDIERFVIDFCEYVEKKYNVQISMINCDHVDVIINSINDNTRYRACKAYKPPIKDRVYKYTKDFAEHNIKFVDGECDDLIDELQNLVFDERAEEAVPLDDGSMQIDTWDSNIYSESGQWNYL